MAKNSISPKFPSDTVVSDVIAQTKLDNVFVHCHENNKLALNSLSTKWISFLAIYAPHLLKFDACGKTTFHKTIYAFYCQNNALTIILENNFNKAVEDKVIRRSIFVKFGNIRQEDYYAWTKPNVDRILQVIATSIKEFSESEHSHKYSPENAFEGFCYIANFLSNGRVNAEQAHEILNSVGLQKPTKSSESKEQAEKVEKVEIAPKEEPCNCTSILAKLQKDTVESPSLKYHLETVKPSAIAVALEKVGFVDSIYKMEPSNYNNIFIKLHEDAQKTVLFKEVHPFVFELSKGIEEPLKIDTMDINLNPTNQELFERGLPINYLQEAPDVYSVNDTHVADLNNIVNHFVAFTQKEFYPNEEYQVVDGIDMYISTHDDYLSLKRKFRNASKYSCQRYNHFTNETVACNAKTLIPLEAIVNYAGALKQIFLEALDKKLCELEQSQHDKNKAVEFLEKYFSQLHAILSGTYKTELKAVKNNLLEEQFDKLAYLTEQEEQKIGQYTCEINRAVATDLERWAISEKGYLQAHGGGVSYCGQKNKLIWTPLSIKSTAYMCNEAGVNVGVNFNSDMDLGEGFGEPFIYHGGEHGPLLKISGLISSYALMLHTMYGANERGVKALTSALERRIKKMFAKSLHYIKGSMFVSLNDFERGLGKDYTYDKVAHMMLNVSENMLDKLRLNIDLMREILGGVLKLYRAAFYIFVQDDYWRYELDPITQEYNFLPYEVKKASVA